MNGTKIRHIAKGSGEKCPICQHDEGCAFFGEDAVLCLRVQEGCATRANGTQIQLKDGMGWLHRLDGSGPKSQSPTVRRTPKPSITKLTKAELERMCKQYRAAVTPERLTKLAAATGLSQRALKTYGVGYEAAMRCWTFPMFDGRQNIIGIRRRSEDGSLKLSVKGSKNGLFIPDDYRIPDPNMLAEMGHSNTHALLLLLPEGPTDAAAATDLGFRAIGRPSNIGGADYLFELLKSGHPQEVVIVADSDPTKYLPNGTPFWPGWEGALSLAAKILPVCGTLKVVKPPERAKDLRAWVQSRGLSGLMRAVIGEAEIVNHAWLRDKNKQVEFYKSKLKKRPA